MKVSERFACRVTGQNRSTQRRSPAVTTPADPDAMRACGCLNAAGASASAPRPRPPCPSRMRRTAMWAVDFQFDATTDGRPVKIVSIVDEHTRECLGGLVDRNITSDELACAAMADWAGERAGLHFIPPGQPWRNGYIESFNSRVRDECLNSNMFWSLAQAHVVISDWKEDYNHRRRHSALGHQAPGRGRRRAGDDGDGARRLVGDLGGGPGHALDATPAGCCGCAGTGCRGRSGA
jgi:putative transposase